MTSHMSTQEPAHQITINGQALTRAEVIAVARHSTPVLLGKHAIEQIQVARTLIETITAEGRTIYGVTTGFGHLSTVHISQDHLVDLQHNLLRSHAAGVGEPLSEEVVRTMMVLLAASLARGKSGVRVEVVQLLIALLNQHISPVIPSRGSVGASGDLAPLAHLGLVLIGEGEAIYRGQRYIGDEALRLAGLTPLRLQAKRDVTLFNGTHLTEAIALLAVTDAEILLNSAEVACAMSIEGLMGSQVPLDPRIHRSR